jgi:nucleotide-binding universal stress UspA family protein
MVLLSSTTRASLGRILFATDFSSASALALPYALRIAERYDSQVFVVHAVRPDLVSLLPTEETSAFLEKAHAHAERQLQKLVAAADFAKIAHRAVLADGEPSAVVNEIIAQENIDLVVVGTHGRTGARKLLLGSAAEAIFRVVNCPVLTVGPHVSTQPPAEVRLRRVLYATDFSPHSDAAAAYAFSLAQEHQAHIALLHVVRTDHEFTNGNSGVLLEFFKRKLRAIVPEGAEDWCDPELIVEFGSPAEGVLRCAAGSHADLIVMGIRRAATFAGHLPPATAYKVVCQAGCPVLTVRG